MKQGEKLNEQRVNKEKTGFEQVANRSQTHNEARAKREKNTERTPSDQRKNNRKEFFLYLCRQKTRPQMAA